MVGDTVRDLLDPQRIVNGDGRLEREYALGRGRTDLLIVCRRAGASAESITATDDATLVFKLKERQRHDTGQFGRVPDR